MIDFYNLPIGKPILFIIGNDRSWLVKDEKGFLTRTSTFITEFQMKLKQVKRNRRNKR